MTRHTDKPFGMKSIILLIGLLALTGCGRKKIDTSTDERMKKSVEAARASLPEKDREKFDESLAVLAMSKVDFSDVFAGRTTAGNIESKVKESLNGKTAPEVIAAGQAVIVERRAKEQAREQERREKERKEALAEIAELQKKKEVAERAKSELAKFKVTRSRFYKRNGGFRDEPIIELSLTNQTTISVSRAHFIGTLSSPGRAVPWLKETFSYKIAGGMEPGEAKELTLAPNMFSNWGKAEAPADAVFTVEVSRLDGPDEKAAFDAGAFDADDAERLTALEKTFGEPK
jgi:hypothetical protein